MKEEMSESLTTQSLVKPLLEHSTKDEVQDIIKSPSASCELDPDVCYKNTGTLAPNDYCH